MALFDPELPHYTKFVIIKQRMLGMLAIGKTKVKSPRMDKTVFQFVQIKDEKNLSFETASVEMAHIGRFEPIWTNDTPFCSKNDEYILIIFRKDLY